jgi:hypothetical protein
MPYWHHHQLLPQLMFERRNTAPSLRLASAVKRSNGSSHEKSAASRGLKGAASSSRSGLLNRITLKSLLTHCAVVRGFSLAFTSLTEGKHSGDSMSTIFSSTWALSAMNLTNASSLFFPRNPWITNFLMCSSTHSTLPTTCQNLKLTFPVGLKASIDCKFDQNIYGYDSGSNNLCYLIMLLI